MHPTITCLNGRFIRASRAMIHVSDRGFRFGDGVFETIRLENGVPFQWETHLARLEKGLAALRITPPTVEWKAIAQRLIKKNRAVSGFIRLAVSRGAGSYGYLPHPDLEATWVMEYQPSIPMTTEPCRLWRSNYRRPPLSTLPGNQKHAQGVNSTLALLEAREQRCHEALLLTQDGFLCSAAAANLFWITNGVLFTPPLSTGCLEGTTRTALVTIAPQISEREATWDELVDADAAFLTNCRMGIWPVAELLPIQKTLAADHPLIGTLRDTLVSYRKTYSLEKRDAWRNCS